MANLNVKLNDTLKTDADELFESLGLDTSTAVRIFLTVAVENGGLPFEVKHQYLSGELARAVYESRTRTNLNGPYDTAEEAVKAMLED